jgi:hypothetical protein
MQYTSKAYTGRPAALCLVQCARHAPTWGCEGDVATLGVHDVPLRYRGHDVLHASSVEHYGSLCSQHATQQTGVQLSHTNGTIARRCMDTSNSHGPLLSALPVPSTSH